VILDYLSIPNGDTDDVIAVETTSTLTRLTIKDVTNDINATVVLDNGELTALIEMLMRAKELTHDD
jgi:hypothetical protein